jgi:probable phosphoglycerate mutase
MIKIYLARHGQCEDNANGILNGHRNMPLTAIGLAQAKELAQKIKEKGIIFDEIYTSPLKRASQTAETITKHLNLGKPKKLDMIIERDFGEMTGKLTADISKLYSPDVIKTDTITYFLSPIGAETFPQLTKRAIKVLHFIKKNHNDQSLLFVTHGDFGKMLYAAYYNISWRNALTMLHFGNSELLLLCKYHSPEKAHIHQVRQYNF